MTTTDDSKGHTPDFNAWRAEAGAVGALADAATPDWTQALHIDEPRAIVSANDMNVSLLALDRDGMAIFDRVEDARFAVEARDGWPRDAARVGVLCERVARLEARIATLTALVAAGDRMEAHAVRFADRCAVLEAALGEAADFIEPALGSALSAEDLIAAREKADALRALAAGGAPSPPAPLLCPFCHAEITPPDHCVHDGEQVDIDCPGCGEEVSICPTVAIEWEVPTGWNKRAAGREPRK